MRYGLAPSVLSCALVLYATYLTCILRVVPPRHILFVLFASVYALFTNTFIRRTVLPPGPVHPRPLAPMKHAARLLFPFTLVFSLFVPTVLLFVAGTSAVDGKPTQLARILASHLFLVMAQICLETVGFLFATVFTLYVRLGVTIAFVSYRIPVLFTWYDEAKHWARSDEAALVPPLAIAMTQAAAVLNIVFWSFALLCFLLLYCLPSVIKEPPSNHSDGTTEKTS